MDDTAAHVSQLQTQIRTAKAHRAEKIAEAEGELQRLQQVLTYWQELSLAQVLAEIERDKQRDESAEERRLWKTDEAEYAKSDQLRKVWWRGCVCGLIAAYPLWWLVLRYVGLQRWLAT